MYSHRAADVAAARTGSELLSPKICNVLKWSILFCGSMCNQMLLRIVMYLISMYMYLRVTVQAFF